MSKYDAIPQFTALTAEPPKSRLFAESSYSKLVYDLKFTQTGVKRWVIRYYSQRSQCQRCGKTFYSDRYPTDQKTGHALEAGRSTSMSPSACRSLTLH